jgi:hypothetical protein
MTEDELTDWIADGAIMDDWQTYSPMTPDQIQDLIELMDTHDGGNRRHNHMAIEGWGVMAALGNWDADTAMRAVRVFYAQPDRPVWMDDDSADPVPRPVLPRDIAAFVEQSRRSS